MTKVDSAACPFIFSIARKGRCCIMVIVLMGVCGCGKTTVGELLAQKRNWSYFDADDFHPRENVEKMAAGIPLTDADRNPWLRGLSDEIGRRIDAGEDVVLGCSALKERYREILVGGRPQVRVVHLKGTRELISGRLQDRVHRYMPSTLLDSQFEALEEPTDAVVVDITPSPEEIVCQICRELGI